MPIKFKWSLTPLQKPLISNLNIKDSHQKSKALFDFEFTTIAEKYFNKICRCLSPIIRFMRNNFMISCVIR
jgi:hypothetical protein